MKIKYKIGSLTIMNKDTVLIFGNGHLAYRVKKLAENAQYTIIHMPVVTHFQGQGPVFDDLQDLFKEVEFNKVAMVYILDDREDYSLGLAIALISVSGDVPITVSLFNENIAPHLKATHPNIHVLNPAKVAAPAFVQAIYQPVERFLRYVPSPVLEKQGAGNPDYLIKILWGSFGALVLASVAYFHFFENLSIINSVYFVVVTVATVGYGDINLLNSGLLSKLVAIFLILGSTFFIWMIFSLTVDRIIKKRTQYSLGRKKYHYQDHVIICGLGRLGYFIADALIAKGERVVIVESNESTPAINHFKNQGVDVYVGDAKFPKVLEDVGVRQAKALISAVNNDYVNLEIGLNARSFNPGLRLILRIFDDAMAQNIKEHLDIHLALSMSALADDTFFGMLTKKED